METVEDTTAVPEPARPHGRRLTGRTIAICTCIALVAAILAGLLANVVLGDDDAPAKDAAGLDLESPVDTDALLDVRLLTIAGDETSLRDQLTAKPMVVNLWAQSCAPCVKEMPLLEQASKDNPEVAFLGVDTQDRLDHALVMAERTGITYPWVQDPKGDFFYAASASYMPTTLVLSPQGVVMASRAGSFKSQAELQAWIQNYLG